MANILEFHSLSVYETAKKRWYTSEIPHFLIVKTGLDPASDLEEQAEGVRAMNLALGVDDEI